MSVKPPIIKTGKERLSLQRLLVSVRGPREAVRAASGGAHIADVEFPASALGTPYPLNILAVRERLDSHGFEAIPISTNIGEQQPVRSSACQAALGVAVAGADFVKCGLAGLPLKAASYLGGNLVRTVRKWLPTRKVLPAVFADDDLRLIFDPLSESHLLCEETDSDGILLDTFDKGAGKGLLDYYSIGELDLLVDRIHKLKKEVWLAGSISQLQIGEVWKTGVDVICVRGAACRKGSSEGRFGEVDEDLVSELIP